MACVATLAAAAITGCESTANTVRRNPNTAAGVALGGATGALIGGAVGSGSDRTGSGALLGGAAGAAIGGVVGNQIDRNQRR
jgi:uncharacterized protein YcfJ